MGATVAQVSSAISAATANRGQLLVAYLCMSPAQTGLLFSYLYLIRSEFADNHMFLPVEVRFPNVRTAAEESKQKTASGNGKFAFAMATRPACIRGASAMLNKRVTTLVPCYDTPRWDCATAALLS